MIKVNFNAYSSYVTDSIYQWDINRVLNVTGLNLSATPEVHFSNSAMDRAIVRQATLNNNVVTVTIPNSILQYPLTINAHIGVYEGDEFKVIETISIPVIPKVKPSDYKLENSDEEIYSFNALENKVDNIVADIGDAINSPKVIGNLSDLNTSVKTNIVGAINSVNSRILPNYMHMGMVTNYCDDLNNLKTNGIFFGHSSLTLANKPTNIQYFSLLVMNYDNVRIQQVAFGTNDTGTPIVKIRTSYYSNDSVEWGAWKSITVS